MTVRTQTHHPVTNGIIPSAGTEANFAELYDLQDGGIDGTNMDLTATFAWTGAHSFTDVVNFDSGLLYVDATNNRIYEGTTTTTTIDSIDYQHQITVLSAATPAFALISTATGSTGVREARYHNSASPAASDQIYHQKIYANNSSSVVKEFARVTAQIHTVTAGSEDGLWYVSVMKAGTLTNTFLAYHDQVQVRPESLVVGTNTNIGPDGFVVGVYTVHSDSNRRVACFSNTDATASGSIFDIYKNSASPAASDVVTQLRFMGNDSAGNYQHYADIVTSITDATSGSEDSQLYFRVQANGTATQFLNATSTAGSVAITITGTTVLDGYLTATSGTVTVADDFLVQQDAEINGGCSVIRSVNTTSTIYGYTVDITNANTGTMYCFNLTTSGAGSDRLAIVSTSLVDTAASAGAYYAKMIVNVSGVGNKYLRLYDS